MEKITKKDIRLIIIIFIFAFVMGMLFQYFINQEDGLEILPEKLFYKQ